MREIAALSNTIGKDMKIVVIQKKKGNQDNLPNSKKRLKQQLRESEEREALRKASEEQLEVRRLANERKRNQNTSQISLAFDSSPSNISSRPSTSNASIVTKGSSAITAVNVSGDHLNHTMEISHREGRGSFIDGGRGSRVSSDVSDDDGRRRERPSTSNTPPAHPSPLKGRDGYSIYSGGGK
jgi:hypothetical protein